MAKVLCKLPNASTNINGIRFVTHRDGMISEEIDDEAALQLADINGYEIHDPGQTDKVAAAVLEAERKKHKAQQQQPNSQPPAPPAGSSSSTPPAGGTTQQSPPAGGTPPAAPPAGSKEKVEGTGKEGTPDPNF